MRRLAFPALFTFVLLGLWIFAKSPGIATATTPKSPSAKSQKSPTTEEVLTEKEELFAASLSPKNQKIFTDQMDKKDRTMAMEMVLESNRKGGTLTGDQAVEQLAQDFHMETPTPMPAPAAGETPMKAPTQTPSGQASGQKAPPTAAPSSKNPTPPSSTTPMTPAPASKPQATPNTSPNSSSPTTTPGTNTKP